MTYQTRRRGTLRLSSSYIGRTRVFAEGPIFLMALITATIAAGLKLSSAQPASQASQPTAPSAETTLLHAFAEILPIDAHWTCPHG